MQMELRPQLELPLLGEVRRAEHGKALSVAAVQHLSGDQRSLDRLADADIVGDQQPHGLELECHQQRNELIRTGVYGDATERAERPRRGADTESQRITQQARAAGVARRLRARWGEGCRRDKFELGKNPRDLVIGGSERPEDQQLGLPRLGEDQPLATACCDERSDGVGHSARHQSAPVLAKDACEAIENRAPIGGMVETDDLPSEVVEASVDERVIGLLVGFVVDRTIDEHCDLRDLVDEIGAGLRRGDQLLRFVRQSAALGDQQVDEPALEIRVGTAFEKGRVIITAGVRFGRCHCAGKVEQQIPDGGAIKDTVIALVAVAEQAVVAGDLAVLAGVFSALEIRAVGSEVAQLQGGGADPRDRVGVVDQSAQHAGPAFSGLEEQQDVASVGGRKRFSGEFLVFELELGLDRSLQRSLEACHLVRFEIHEWRD
jgi:hypothetical protein